jgi:hypothetical protein
MARIQSSEQLTTLMQKFFDKQIEATVKLVRTAEGMEADVTVEPTEDLTRVAYSLVQSDLGLSYDGANVRVLSNEGGLPEEKTVER